jgi:hypothetical protein
MGMLFSFFASFVPLYCVPNQQLSEIICYATIVGFFVSSIFP